MDTRDCGPGEEATIWLLPWAMTTWTTTLQEGNAKNMVLTRSSMRVLKIRQTPLIFLCRVCEFVCRLRQLLRWLDKERKEPSCTIALRPFILPSLSVFHYKWFLWSLISISPVPNWFPNHFVYLQASIGTFDALWIAVQGTKLEVTTNRHTVVCCWLWWCW